MSTRSIFTFSFLALSALCGAASTCTAQDIPLADFEGDTYAPWKAEGSAFGTAPAPGTLPGQMKVDGHLGRGLANSFNGGDDARGRLIGPEFVIERRFISFLIGGGGWEKTTSLNLIVDGQTVRAATGPNTRAGGSEKLERLGWDVGELKGKRAHLEIVDDAVGGWGHINVDDIMQTDTKPPVAIALKDASRDFKVSKRWLQFPIKNGAKTRTVLVRADGKIVRRFEAELANALADSQPDWWAPLDVSAWNGKTLSVTIEQMPENSRAFEQISLGDVPRAQEGVYREAGRGQIHFSARRGWLNDPNGLAFYNGEYHLFFQHNPYGWNWGNMHWGHATSRDLVHWQEHGEALYPDESGTMFSGSAVVDWKNSSGFGQNNKPPLVLIYTAAGEPFTQGIAHSTDGRRFTKYAGNPVVKNITGGNRDPKVFWHAPTRRWVQVLYVEEAGKHTIHFFSSPNLRDWTPSSVARGIDGTQFLFECPDFFELPVDGDAKNTKWVLTGANSEYAIGSFDGKQFTPQSANLPGHRGRSFYAAQTFSDEPKGRRIQIGWFQTATPGMPFNQSMSLPMELKLKSTPDGPRLSRTPIDELKTLRAKSHAVKALALGEGAPNPLAKIKSELLEIRAEFEPGQAREVVFNVRGVPVIFDAAKQELVVNGHRAPSPTRNNRQTLTIFVDRTGLEVLADDGLTFVPMPINLKPQDTSLSVEVKGGPAKFSRLDVHELKSAWR